MVLLNTYVAGSLLLPLLFVADCANVHREFFTTVVELTNSSVFRLLCVNGFLALAVLLWMLCQRFFFGKLNNAEREAFHRSLPMFLSESILGPLYFNVSLFSSVGATALLTVVVRLLHTLAEERATTLHIVENRAERARMLWRLGLFFAVFMPIDLYVVFDVAANTAPSSEDDAGLRYMSALLFMQFLISNVQCLVRILFAEVVGDTGGAAAAFYVETLFSLLKTIVFFVSFSYVWMVSLAPFPLVRLLLHNIILFGNKLYRLLRYQQLTRFVRALQDAKDEDLTGEPRCAICYDDMKPQQGCKQLPCGHCYHEACLRRWFESKSTCPYCRADLLDQIRRLNTPASAANNQQAVLATNAGQPQQQQPQPQQQQQQQQPQQPQPQQQPQPHLQPQQPQLSPPQLDEAGLRAAYVQYREQLRVMQHRHAPTEGQPAVLSPCIHSNGAAVAEGRRAAPQPASPPAAPSAQRSVMARRLAAYMEFEVTVQGAMERLQERMRDIDAHP